MEKRRLIWFILARVVVVTLFLVSTVVLRVKEPGSLEGWALPTLTRLIVATYLFSILTLLTLRVSDRFTRSLTYFQIIWDLLFVTILLLVTGGVGSPFSFLYLLSIINASVLLARREALYTASLCGILYGALIDFQFYGLLAPLGLSSFSAQQFGANYIFYTVFLNIVAFFLTAFLTGSLAERARKSEMALQEKVIDYEELERLNSAIVASLASGLLTVNGEGRVRVFNPCAEALTGLTLAEAYNRPLSEVIPGFVPFADGIFSGRRGEIRFEAGRGDPKILGYSTAPLIDVNGASFGAVITFQDLTRLKEMEAELKRADRLAAIGELSARMAHEIRNPLASISGSVQLLAQGAGIDAQDRKLLEIVVRETDRLNELISDFLAYARPKRPELLPLNLMGCMADLESLLASDPRFAGIAVEHSFAPDLTVSVDIDQFKQVMWNLLVNAAEAMPEGGCIKVGGKLKSGSRFHEGKAVKVTVTDSGTGMDGDKMKRIFEPFFTTKANGTGLGLATVYRIIEAHGGRIMVESAEGEGTMFTIYLPAV